MLSSETIPVFENQGNDTFLELQAHFVLGKDETVTKLEVRWPSGIVQVLENVVSNQLLLVVTEPER